MVDDYPTQTSIKIVELDHTVKQLTFAVTSVQNQVRELDNKLDQIVTLQMQQQHTGQAIERAFAAIENNAKQSDDRWAANTRETAHRIERWEAWKVTSEEARAKHLENIYATINNAKGGVRALWLMSALIWGLVLWIGNYYVTNATEARERLYTEISVLDARVNQRIQTNSERLRNIELYLAKGPDYVPAK